MRVVIDMESDGLIDNATRLHCLCYHDIDTKESKTLTTYDDMRDFLQQENLTIIGHNIIRFDIPMFVKFLGIDPKTMKKVDTLGLSWYLYPYRDTHNLEKWGEDLGIDKPKIDDWTQQNIENIIVRCEEDVKINVKLFYRQIHYLMGIYDKDPAKVNRLIGYITFKLECAAEQEAEKWKLDVPKTLENLEYLTKEKQIKFEVLSQTMPKHTTYKIKEKPKVMYKKGKKKDDPIQLSERGKVWFELLKELGLPEYHNGAIKLVDKVLDGNPQSYDQLKEWLFNLGWKPETFKFVRPKVNGRTDYTAPVRKIPQINTIDGSDICDSVKELYEVEPKLQNIESYFVLSHRIGILKSFMDSKDKDDYLTAGVNGFTNTMRFNHTKPLVNLPTILKRYGNYIRGVLIAPNDDYTLCNTDLSGAEESTKHHYMYYYDPEYVKKIRTSDYDPHLDIAITGNLITEEDSAFYKTYNKDVASTEEKIRYIYIKDIRNNKAKKVNFGAVYGAGIPKIVQTGKMPIKIATILHTAYWKANWSVKQIALDVTTKSVEGQLWLYNPVSQLWYFLKAEKDKFSTLNQGKRFALNKFLKLLGTPYL